MNFLRTTGRAVYGTAHIKLNKLFNDDRAGFRAPCFLCGQPHKRKCDAITMLKNERGIPTPVRCARLMCDGCTTRYRTMSVPGTDQDVDLCPEHDEIMRKNLK